MKDKLLSLMDDILSFGESAYKLIQHYKHELMLGWKEYTDTTDRDSAVLEAIITGLITLYFVAVLLFLLFGGLPQVP